MEEKKKKVDDVRLLKTAKGQMDGIIKMIEEGRSSKDISEQLMATGAILKKVNNNILINYLKELINSEEIDIKQKEIEEIINNITKNR